MEEGHPGGTKPPRPDAPTAPMTAAARTPTPPMPRSRHRTRLLLLASVSALGLGLALPQTVLAQSSPFIRRGTGAADPAAIAARTMQAQGQDAARAAAYARNSMEVFARAAQTSAAMVGLQAAARAAAEAAPNPGVPNGLAPGGLVPVLDASLWRGAAAPVQAPSATRPERTEVAVRQTESKAILTWQSFNVGRETDLRFDQSAGGARAREWAVLNRIEDPNAQPSRILGSIRAEGQVYVINRNGILFGATAQVNVSTLVASALDLGGWNEDVEARNQRFRAGLLPQQGQNNYAPNLSLDRFALLRADGRPDGAPRRIAVEVEPGAQITLREEGTAILAAPQVLNAGTITAPSGQVILGAGVGLRLDTPVGDPFGPRIGLAVESLRSPFGRDEFGLETYVSEARNAGLVSAPRGNITLSGTVVRNEAGAVLSATTANNRPGSVILTARDVGGPTTSGPNDSLNAALFRSNANRVPQMRFGEVVLAPGSLVEVTAETGDDQVVFNTATAAFEQSRLAITGAVVRLQEGSIVRAPAGTLRISGDLPVRVFPDVANDSGRLQMVVLERNSVIDLGGLKDLTAPVTRNLVEVQTFRNELRDAPLQRDGFLYDLAQNRGKVTIDTRIGSAIVDWQPTANGIPYSVRERQGRGGSVEIEAERVFALEGSRIDVSGGTLTWQGGVRPATTRVLADNGRIYDIGTAPADLAYVGLPGQFTRTQPRWNVTETYASPLLATRPVYEAGYVEGFDAGAVSIAGRFYGDGVVQGGAFTGERQLGASRANDGNPDTSLDLPSGGTLQFRAFRPENVAIGGVPVQRNDGITGLVNATIVPAIDAADPAAAPLPADFAGRLELIPPVAGAELRGDRRYRLRSDDPAEPEAPLPAGRFDSLLSARDVLNRGWSQVRIETDGRATIRPGVTLGVADATAPAGARLADGAALTIDAWAVELQGAAQDSLGGVAAPARIVIPSGSITLTANTGERVEAPETPETLAAAPRLFPLLGGGPRSALDGTILVGPGAVLSTRGRWVNDRAARDAEGRPTGGTAFLHGGAITLATRYAPLLPEEIPPLPEGVVVDPTATAVAGRDIRIGAGAVLDVSGGGRLSTGGSLTGGRGGTLTLSTFAALAASPTGAPVEDFPLAGPGGYFIAGAPARPVLDPGTVLAGFGTGEPGGGAGTGRGGVLALSAPRIALGRPPGAADEAGGVLVLPDLDRFAAAGFADLRLTAPRAGRVPYATLQAGDIEIAPGSVIAPVAATQILRPRPEVLGVPTGSPAEAWSRIGVLDAPDRAAMRLSLAAGNRLTLGDAATRIAADPGGARGDTAALVSLSAAQPILLAGTLEAPAGEIRVTGTGSNLPYDVQENGATLFELAGAEFQPGHALWIAATARLLAPGVAQATRTSRGLTAGGVRPGGTVTLAEGRGTLVLEAGSLIDVSGAAGTTSRRGSGVGAAEAKAETVPLASAGGAISLQGARGVFVDGALRALAGGPGAPGGLLTLNAPSPPGLPVLANERVAISVPSGLAGPGGIVVRADGAGPSLPAGARFGGPIDPTLAQTGPSTWTGGTWTDRAFLAGEALGGSGIEQVHLAAAGGVVLFESGAALRVPRSLQIEATRIQLLPALPPTTGAAAALPVAVSVPPPVAFAAAPYVLLLGAASGRPDTIAATAPAPEGALTIEADQVDVMGGVLVAGVARTTLASRGDLRLIGLEASAADEYGRVIGGLATQGDLVLRAAQVYPATGSDFTLTARDADPARPGRTLRIEGAGGPVPEAPLAAGSLLTLEADRIEQAGVLRSPQGALLLRPGTSVDLLAGSLTSVSAEGRVVVYGQTASDQNPIGVELYPSIAGPNANRVGGLTAPPEKVIDIAGPEIRIAPGAVVDASGGGGLLAWRFVAGPGGSRDVLARADYGTNFISGTPATPVYQFADRRDVFAILPGAQPAAAPYSAYLRDSGSSLGRGDVTAEVPAGSVNAYGQQTSGRMPGVGDQIALTADIPGLPAGTYTLLPGRYAILPGAYRVVMPPGAGAAPRVEAPSLTRAVARADGSYLLSGYRGIAGTTIRDDRPRLVQVSPASSWSLYSSLFYDTADAFFAARADRLEQPRPRLPADAGRLTLAAQTALVLDGRTLFGRGAGGRGGQVEITADRIAITPGGAPYAGGEGFLPISDAALSGLGAETLTIGGTRTLQATGETTGERLNARARSVVLAEGAVLSAPETLLVARTDPGLPPTPLDGIRVEAGARLVALGEVAGRAANLLVGREEQGPTIPAISGDAAILRVSNAAQVQVLRENLPVARPNLPDETTGAAIGPAASIEGASILLDATGAATVAEDARFLARTLDLVGGSIVLGEAPAEARADALSLSTALLDQLIGIGALTLRSRGAIDVYDAVRGGAVRAEGIGLAAETVTLDAAAIHGMTAGAALSVTASDRAILRNSGASAPPAVADGTGRLGVTATGAARPGPGGETLPGAGEIRIGPGSLAVSGFGVTSLDAAGALVVEGSGDLALPGPLVARAALVTGDSGASRSIAARGAVTLSGTGQGGVPAAATPATGARLAIEAPEIALSTRLAFRAGTVELIATAGDLALGEGAAIEAQGVGVPLFDQVRLAPGGRIALTAAAGSVRVAPGVTLDVSGPGGGGALALAAPAGIVELDGVTLRGLPGSPGALGGSFSLSTGGAVDLAALDARLEEGGFQAGRSVHSRQGDLVLPAGATMRAREVALTADGGSVEIGGLVNARGPKGGRISLFARDEVRLLRGAELDVGANQDGQPGGTVELGTARGPLLLEAGSTIAVGGRGDDGTRGSLVRLRLPEAQAVASVLDFVSPAARRVEIEPYRVLEVGTTIDPTAIGDTFQAIDAARLAATLLAGKPQRWRITPGVELRAPGALTLPAGSDIDLGALRTATDDPGVLTLRAGGDLTLLSSISDGFTSPGRFAAQRFGRSWSIRLVAGAEGGSADPLAVRGLSGSVLLGEPWALDGTVGTFDGTVNTSPRTNPITVRTGTGAIDIAAARDVLLRDPDVTVYTAGRPVAERNWVGGVEGEGAYFWDPVPPTYGTLDSTFLTYTEDPSAPDVRANRQVAYPEEGGDLRIRAGRDILAVVLDPLGNNAGQTPNEWLQRQGLVDAGTGLFLYRAPIPNPWAVYDTFVRQPRQDAARTSQTSWWIDFTRFDQGIAALGGGDVDIRAGRDFQGSVSIPTTGRTGGGLPETYSYSYLRSNFFSSVTLSGAVPAEGQLPAQLVVNGGGDLRLNAGRDIGAASQFLLGRGEGTIRAGGSLLAQEIGTVTPDSEAMRTTATVGTVLALSDARFTVTAGGGIAASVYDPFQAPPGRAQQVADAWGFGGTAAVGRFGSYTPDSGVTLRALGGDATLLGSFSNGDPFGPVSALRAAPRARGPYVTPEGETEPRLLYRGHVAESVFAGGSYSFIADGPGAIERLPPRFEIAALGGDIGFQRFGQPSAGETIQLALQPASEGGITLLAAGSILRPNILLAEADLSRIASATRPFYEGRLAFIFLPGNRFQDGPEGLAYASSTDPLPLLEAPQREADATRSLVYAAGGSIERPRIVSAERIGVYAGRDITDLDAVVQHAQQGDLSFFRAGRDIGTKPDPILAGVEFGNTVELRGPGRLQLIAGRDIAPIRRASTVADPTLTGDADNGVRTTGNAANLLYPQGGAAIDLLFGVGPGRGFDTLGYLDRYLDPANATQQSTTYRVELADFRNGGVTWFVQQGAPAATDAATIGRIRALPEPERLALAIDLHFREIDAAGRAAAEATAAGRTPDYGRGFASIGALFPFGGYSGNLNLQNTYVRTEQGGDINVLGPGGDFFLGAITGSADRFPDRVGVLTLNHGAINLFTHGDIQVGQSRVITADGGDILMWSSTADINAGLGSRTARFVPPFQVNYLEDATRVPNPTGLITGSGIATYAPLTPLDRPAAPAERVAATLAPTETVQAALADIARQRTLPSINLIAPVGAVDFGDAGVRTAGNLSVAAQVVLNAANVQVGGVSTGVPTVSVPNVGAAVSASAAAGQAASAASEVARQAAQPAGARDPQDQPSIITVEVLGFGGSEGDVRSLQDAGPRRGQREEAEPPR